MHETHAYRQQRYTCVCVCVCVFPRVVSSRTDIQRHISQVEHLQPHHLALKVLPTIDTPVDKRAVLVDNVNNHHKCIRERTTLHQRHTAHLNLLLTHIAHMDSHAKMLSRLSLSLSLSLSQYIYTHTHSFSNYHSLTSKHTYTHTLTLSLSLSREVNYYIYMGKRTCLLTGIAPLPLSLSCSCFCQIDLNQVISLSCWFLRNSFLSVAGF